MCRAAPRAGQGARSGMTPVQVFPTIFSPTSFLDGHNIQPYVSMAQIHQGLDLQEQLREAVAEYIPVYPIVSDV
jgi:hypothetical protein